MKRESDINLPQLLKTPSPQADESLMGYILRLTEENVYLSPSWIFDLAGLKVNTREGGWPTLYRSVLDSSGLEHVTGLTRHEIERLRYQISDTDYSLYIRGIPVSKEFVRYSLPKVCPACLKESGYCQYIWDLLPVTACPTHKAMLIDKCPGCQKRIRWIRPKISKCRCGVDWRDAELSRIDSNELKLPNLIYERCGITCVNSSLPQKKQIISCTLELNDLIQVLSVMADYYLLITKGQRIRPTTENALCHTAYSFVASILKDWPRNFFKFLGWVRTHEGYRGVSNLHVNVSKQCGKPSLFFVISALEDFIENIWHTLKGSGGLYLPIGKQFINKREACLKMRIDEDWLDVLIARGEVRIFRKDRAEILIYVPSIELLLSNKICLMTHCSAAEFLGVSASDVIYLIRNGYLQPLKETEIDGFREWALNPPQVSGLMRKIEGKIINGGLPKDGKVTLGRDVLKYLKQYGLSLGKFIVDILNDKIAPIGEIPGEGITKFLFQKDQVIRYRQNLQPEDLSVDIYNYREKFLEKLKLQRAIQTSSSGKGGPNIPEELLRNMVIFLDSKWAQNDLVYTNKGVESFNILKLAKVVKLFRIRRASFNLTII